MGELCHAIYVYDGLRLPLEHCTDDGDRPSGEGRTYARSSTRS